MSNNKVAATFHPDDGAYWTCRICHTVQRVLEEHAETIGYEEKARPITVLDLACGHQVELYRNPNE